MIFYRIFFPFIWLLNASANRCLRLFGLEAAGKNRAPRLAPRSWNTSSVRRGIPILATP
jgi:CBS domain containing-hemolysin-like protein